MSGRPLAIDLFCGLGGWTEGLLAEGWDVNPTPVLLAAPSPTWFIYSAIVPDPAMGMSKGAEP